MANLSSIQALGEGLVGILLSTSAVDVVQITDQSGSENVFKQNPDGSINQTPSGTWAPQVFGKARPLSATVKQVSRVMDHPLESGQLISDYKVILPVEIEIPVIVSSTYYRGVYQQILSAYTSSRLFIVQTRTSSYQNMIISEMPHQEDAERYTAITILIRFRQVQIVKPSTTGTTANPDFAPANSTSAPTQNVGQLSTAPLVGVDGPYGLEPIPYTTSSGGSSIINYTVPTQTQNGTEMLPIFNTGNQGSLGSVSGLPQSASSYNTPNLAAGGQSQAGASASTINPLQAYGMQGGL